MLNGSTAIEAQDIRPGHRILPRSGDELTVQAVLLQGDSVYVRFDGPGQKVRRFRRTQLVAVFGDA